MKHLFFIASVLLSALPVFAAVDWFADLPSNAAPATDANAFEVPKAGPACILVRVREKPGVRRTGGVTMAKVTAALDGGEKKSYVLKVRPHWTWQLLGGRLSYEVFSLTAGRHEISLATGEACDKVEIGSLVVTDRPGEFEPR